MGRVIARRAAALLLVVFVTSGSGFGMVGDSVGTQVREEVKAVGGVVVARGGADIPAGRPAVRRMARSRLRPIVIELGLVDLGDFTSASNLRLRIRRVLRDDMKGVRCRLWVDVPTRSPYELWYERATLFNRILAEEAERHGAHVIRWSRFSTGHRNWFWPDGFHLSPRGQLVFARFLQDQVTRRC